MEEFHVTDQNTEHRRQSKGHVAVIVEAEKILEILCGGCGGDRQELFAFLVHIGMNDTRDQLHKQHHAHNAEQVCNAVAHGHGVGMVCGNRLLRGGERRSGGQRAREQSGDDRGQLLGIKTFTAALDQTSDADTTNSGKRTCQNDGKAEEDVGLEILLHVLEEVRSCDKADGRDKQHKSKVLHDLQRIGCIGDRLLHAVNRGRENNHIGDLRAEKRAVKQCDDEHAGSSERNALDGHSAQCIPERRNGKHGYH